MEDRHSGEDLDRPGLNAALELASKTKIDALIVYDTDRLSRGGPAHHAIIEMQLEKAGTKIEYVLGDYNNDSPESALSRMIKQSIAWYENKQRRERVLRGRNAKVRSGKVIVGARPPYGYICEDSKLVINQEEAEVVRKVYKLLLDGASTREIARVLHSEGIPTKGDTKSPVHKSSNYAVWHPASIKKIIVNETYTGVWYFGKTKLVKINGKRKQIKKPKSEWVAVEVPPVIDLETFKKARTRLSENRFKSKRNTKREYLLQGSFYCSCKRNCACGYRNKNLFYRCPVRQTHEWEKNCPTGFYVKAETLDNLVWNKIIQLILNPEYLKVEVEKQRQKANEDTVGIRAKLEATNKAVEDTERKIGILLDQLLEGDFPKEVINERKQLLVQKLKQLELEKTGLEEVISASTITPSQEEDLMRLVKTTKEGLDNVTFEHKRKILQALRVRIDVQNRTSVKLSAILPVLETDSLIDFTAPSPG